MKNKAKTLSHKNSGKNSGHPPFEPGHAPLPGGGRPKGVRNWATVLREEMEDGKITQSALAKVLLRHAKRGNLKALEMIIERQDGKPLQPIRMSGEIKTPGEMSESEIDLKLKELKNKLSEIEKG